jgi:hypothetical protein
LFYVFILSVLTSFSIAWRVESGTRILIRPEIDTEPGHDVDIEYSNRVTMLIPSIRAESECRYENSVRWSVYSCWSLAYFAFTTVNCLHSATNLQTVMSSISLLTFESNLRRQKISIDLMLRILKWCIIMFLSFISSCRLVCWVFNAMFISLTSSSIWIKFLWVFISMSYL